MRVLPRPTGDRLRLRLRSWSVLCSLLLLLLAGAVFAEPAQAGQQAQPQHYAPPVGISLEQAADKVRRQTGGRVLSASPEEKGGRRGYNVRVLVDGKRVKQYYVDADGRVSSR